MMHVELKLLGGFELSFRSRPVPLRQRKLQALLAYLAVRAGRPHSRETVTALLWGDTPERLARQSLRQATFRLRRVLATARRPGLLTERNAVTLRRGLVDLDVAAFERLARGHTQAALAAAAALYRGPLLDGLSVSERPFEEWLEVERGRLHELAVECLTRLLRHQMSTRHLDTAAQTAVRLLALDPLQESIHRALMQIYTTLGRRAAALRQYQRCVSTLQRELGVEPEAATRRLYLQLLRQQVGTAGPRPIPSGLSTGTSDIPLVGRGAELSWLRKRLADAGRGHGHVVLVTGEGGIGKTRLLEELIAEAARRGVRLLTGRAYETEQALPLRPWIEALRSAHALAGIPSILQGELVRLFPELAGGENAPPITPESHVRLFEALDRLLAGLSAEQTLLLALEDINWADEMSLRLFSFLARRVPARRVLLLATAREEQLSDTPVLESVMGELAAAPQVEHLVLSALSRPGTEALVRALARPGTGLQQFSQVVKRAWTLSEGSPFVIVETVRALETGHLPDAGDVAFPLRVREMISARLQRLTPRARDLACIAAALEREFDLAVLQRSAGLGARDIAEAIEELIRRRVLVVVGERFDFTHVWLRNAVYDTMLAPRRVAAHEAVGQALEEVHAGRLDEIADRLAFHFSRAGESTKALTYLVRLADRMARTYALTDAVRTLREARTHAERLLSPHRDQRSLEVVYRLANALVLLGHSAEAWDVLRAEASRVERLHDAALSGPYHFWTAYALDSLGHNEEAVRHAQRALVEGARCGDRITMGQAGVVLGRASYILGRAEEGIAHGRQAVAALEQSPETWWLGQAYYSLGANLLHLGEFAEALNVFTRMREIGQSIGDTRLQTQAGWLMGRIHALTGDSTTGIALCKEALDLAADPVARATALGQLGAAHWESNAPEAAIPLLEESIGQLQHLAGFGGYRFRQLDGFLTAGLSECYLLTGQIECASELAERALKIATEGKWAVAVAYAQRALGRVACGLGRHHEAEAHLTHALDLFASTGTRFQTARIRLFLSKILWDSNRPDAAIEHLRQARHTFRVLDVPAYVALVERQAHDLGVTLE